MKLFAAVTVAAFGGRCIDGLSGPILMEPTTTPLCNTAITSTELTDCGTSNRPCPAYRKSNDTSLCDKTYRMGYKYPGEGEHRNATIYVKVVEIDANMTEEWLLGQQGWAEFCPFQCASNAVCAEAMHNCTDNATVSDFQYTGSVALQIPGSAKLGVTGLDLQWKALDGSDNSGDTTAVQDNERLRMSVSPAELWDTNVAPTDKVCPGYTMDKFNTIDVKCYSKDRPCYVMSSDPCGTCRRLVIPNPGYTETNETICKGGNCKPNYWDMHVVTVVSMPELNSSIYLAQSGWQEICHFGCKAGDIEQCTWERDACLSDAVTIKDSWPKLDGVEFWRPGTMNMTRPLIVSSVQECLPAGATRVGVTSLATVLLAMVVMFV